MSDKRINELTEKPSLADTDLTVVADSSGVTWRTTLQILRDHLLGFVETFTGSPDRDGDFVIFRRSGSPGGIRKVPIKNLLPSQTVATSMIQTDAVTADKLAPASVTHDKLAQNCVHTENIENATPSNFDNYPDKSFGTGVTTAKICDAAVTGIKGGVPPGAVFHFAALTAPEGYLVCNGDTIPAFDINNTSVSVQGVPAWRLQDLRAVLGTTFGAAGKLPDLRGVFVRGYGGGQGPTTSSHNGSSGVGRSGSAVYKHFIHQATGAVTAANIGTLATNQDTNAAFTEFYVVEYTDSATTKDNPGEGGYNPRSNAPITAVAFAKGGSPVLPAALSGNARIRIYAMRKLLSGEFGAHQEQRYMAHTHAVSENNHGHTGSGAFGRGAFNHQHTVDIRYRGFEGNGGTHGLRPWDGTTIGAKTYSTTFASFSGDQPVSVSINAGSTNSTCERSFSYGYAKGAAGALPSAGAVNFSRPVEPGNTSDPVDETRPFNVALLPCIKY